MSNNRSPIPAVRRLRFGSQPPQVNLPPRPDGVTDADWNVYTDKVVANARLGMPNPMFGVAIPGQAISINRTPFKAGGG